MLGAFLTQWLSRKWFSRKPLTAHRHLPTGRSIDLRRRLELESLDLRILPTASTVIALDDYSPYAPAQMQEDSSLNIAVLDNDLSPDILPLSIVSVAPAGHGSVVVNGDNTITYTPDINYFGADSFQYQITDGVNGDAWATVFLDVAPVNDAPIAADDGFVVTLTTNEDAALTAIDVLGNDSDIDGDALFVSIYSQASHGVAAVNGDGTISYTPNSDYFGSDSFVYQVDDGNGGYAWATVYLDVTSVNDAPIATDDGAATPLTTDESAPLTAIDVLGNDSDLDGDTPTVSIYSQAGHGIAIANGDGTIDYTPDDGYFGSDSFVYQLDDGNGGYAWATVYVDVALVNSAPLAGDDLVTLDEDTFALLDLASNDSDPDGDALNYTIYSQATYGVVSFDGAGALIYTPHADFHGTDSFVYQISDPFGGTSTATVAITVLPINDAPTASDVAISTFEDGALTNIAVTPGVDLDGDILTVTIFTQPAHGSAAVNGDGTVSYSPDLDYHGADSIDYLISDGNGGEAWATIYITVDAVNDFPTATSETIISDEDASVVVAILENDFDVDGDVLSASIFYAPQHGYAALNGDGTITYTPESGYHGYDFVVYQVDDGNGGYAWGQVHFYISSVNDAPFANDDGFDSPYALPQNGALTGFSVLTNDYDLEGDALTAALFSQASHGVVTVEADGAFTYTPDAGYYGYDSFVYQISDGNGGEAWATVYLAITQVNQAPTAGDDAYEVLQNQPTELAVLINDVDPDADPLTVSVYSTASHGMAVANSDGTITYTPDAGYYGYDSFVYQISDGNGGEAWATVTLDISLVNETPIVTDDVYQVDEDSTLTFGVLDNDYDPDGDMLGVYYYSNAEHGSVQYNSDGTLTYTPDENYVGSDVIYYLAGDDYGGMAWGTVVITVLPVNDAPAATDLSVEVYEDESLSSIDVLTSCFDLEADALTVSIASGASHGSVVVNGDGTLAYAPEANFFGEDSFVYQVSDGNGGEASATVYVNVFPVSEPAPALTLNLEYGEQRMVTLSGMVSGENVGGLTVTFSGAVCGTTVTEPDGSYSFTAEATCLGEVYAVTENEDLTPSNVGVVVIESNVPTIVDFAATFQNGCQYKFTGRVVDEWAAGLVVVLSSAMTISGQTVTVDPDGTFTFYFELQTGEWGEVEARVADCWSTLSNPAQTWIAQI